MRPTSSRSGYAMMLVLVFIVLFLSLFGVAFRQTAAALRIETVRELQILRDEGSLHALARALALLETGHPPYDPYVCGVTIATPSDPRSQTNTPPFTTRFTVTFTSVVGTNNWDVRSFPTPQYQDPLLMPSSFLP